MSLTLCHASYSRCFIIYVPSPLLSLSISSPVPPLHFLDFLHFSGVTPNCLFISPLYFFSIITQTFHLKKKKPLVRSKFPVSAVLPHLRAPLRCLIHQTFLIHLRIWIFHRAQHPFSHNLIIQASSSQVDKVPPSAFCLTSILSSVSRLFKKCDTAP